MVKIIVIGAGISGLSTYLFLRKHLLLTASSREQHEVKIYEAYDIHHSKFNASLSDPAAHDSTKALSSGELDPIFTPQAIGSAIGISRNGLSVLSRLDDDGSAPRKDAIDSSSINHQMALHGHPISSWKISTARGFDIVDVGLAPNHKGEPKADSLSAKDPALYHGIMIVRQACWEILRDRVLEVAPDVVKMTKIVDVTIGTESTRNLIKFEDGSLEEADLVIGADGLRSVLRRAMFQPAQKADNATQTHEAAQTAQNEQKSWLTQSLSCLSRPGTAPKNIDFVSPHYEGLVGVGGFVPSSLLESRGHTPGTMSIVFGPNGFFGYGYLTSAPAQTLPPSPSSKSSSETAATTTTGPKATSQSSPSMHTAPGSLAGWWSTFSSPSPYPYSTTDPLTAIGFNKPLALAALQTRHKSWNTPTIAAILSFVASDTAQHGSAGKALDASYPTWTTPELPSWNRNGRAVLVGDAAHALQPSSGQGACQALEDAETLALFLKHYLHSSISPSAAPLADRNPNPTRASPPSFPYTPLLQALTSYAALRSPRVHKIHVRAQRMSSMKSDMSIFMEYTLYLILWMTTWGWFKWTLKTLGVGDMDGWNEELFGYDLPGEVKKYLRGEEEREVGVGR